MFEAKELTRAWQHVRRAKQQLDSAVNTMLPQQLRVDAKAEFARLDKELKTYNSQLMEADTVSHEEWMLQEAICTLWVAARKHAVLVIFH